MHVDETKRFDDEQYEKLCKLREETRNKKMVAEGTPPTSGDAKPSYPGEQMQFFVSTSVTQSEFSAHVAKCSDCLTAIAETIMRDVVAGIKMTGQVHSHNTYDVTIMELVHKRASKPGGKVERARISARKKEVGGGKDDNHDNGR